ncbi:hypothetical protein BDZ89DRAFT_1074198 [Hymenopellis radicata]|nr:hypothetical protein BDZ89DRAFT_1074198 [Hymenopellis radicata]
MEKRDLEIDFSLDHSILPGTSEFNLLKRMRFWEDSARPWLLDRGYTLYNHFCLNETLGWTARKRRFRAGQRTSPCRVKLVRRESEESRIMHFLLKAQNKRPDKWGDAIASPWFNSVAETRVVIHSLLSALAFLHGSGIVHRDIAPRNTLVNHFALDSRGRAYPLRSAMRKDGRMKYVLFDFNLALMFPASATHASCRLPVKGGFFASLNAPTDLSQGEYDYEPFAFDVGCLGMMFRRVFQHLAPFAPILAPLIDGMVTWDVRARFTAEEALQFFEQHVSHLDENLLHTVPREYDFNEYDRWSELPPEFVRTWVHLRIPPEPITRKILRYMCQYRICDMVVQWIRRIVRGLFG